jgi:threonylcarbamoyladenosine tRNA methylthiotransferase MtaB
MTDIITFGCRLNAAESEIIAGLARDLPDTVIVNTCAVTAEAERQARQAIRRIHRERPGARIVVTGCAAQIDPQRYALPGVAHVVGNAAKLARATWEQLDDQSLSNGPRIAPARISVAPFTARIAATDAPPAFAAHTRAFIEVQQGCDHRCTFCVIPFGRGPSRSLPIERALARVRDALDAGAREVVLTGVDLTAWGDDLPERPRLGDLVVAVLDQVPALPRLRLSSLDPAEIDEALLARLADPRLMPHVHLSLQAGDDVILARMKRRHRVADAVAMAARIRAVRPDAALGADIIAGFPTESDDAFARTLAHVEQLDLPHLHVFPFSARAGTPAARMPQVPRAAVKERAARLRAAGDAARARLGRRLAGTTAQVLVERDGVSGHCAHFLKVRLDRAAAPGTIVAARIADGDSDTLHGVAA